MLKELLKNKKFLKATDVFMQDKDVIDVIIFGSSVREKENPFDIDILVIYLTEKRENTDETYQFRKRIEEIVKKNVHAVSIGYKNLFKPEFLPRQSILSEGFSMKIKNYLSEGFGFSSRILFKYSLKEKNNSKRMQFYYALYGRKKEKGILEKSNCLKFSDSIILSPIENSELLKNFFKKNSIQFIEIPVLIPERVLNYLVNTK